jgi:diadenylate cyclase
MLRTVLSFFEDLRQNFRIADAIDIAVIAVLLYSALVWFKQTASRSVLIGVSVLAAVYFLARVLDMYLTSLVFHTAFAVLLVMMVVVFQEEIRRAFERVAILGTLRQRRLAFTFADEADALVEAAFALAARKSGALIVLQGREPLGRHLDGGIELSGCISKPLLYSIFDPSSPGHDGAVIVERDRIEQFAAHLPISKNHKEIHGRGTRHSAALGLSECSDAMIIVVSEERGVVSVAERGKLKEMRTAADLKGRFERFFEDRFPVKTEAAWKRLATHHARLKLLALFLAVVAWFLLASSIEKMQISYVVPIEYRNIPENAHIDEWAPAEAIVTLSGSERAFRLFDRRLLRISVDLSEARNGTEQISITEKNVTRPPNVNVDRIKPNEIRVRLKSPPSKGQPATTIPKG